MVDGGGGGDRTRERGRLGDATFQSEVPEGWVETWGGGGVRGVQATGYAVQLYQNNTFSRPCNYRIARGMNLKKVALPAIYHSGNTQNSALFDNFRQTVFG
jgi:hypothetical protein